MSKTLKITLSMIVKNEEKNLRECLESVKNVVDEIVIVDTGSTDETIHIAKEFDAEVYHYKWRNDFSSARNYALSKSTGDWILYLDADEKLSEKSISEINKVTENTNLIGCRCIVNNLDDRNGKPNYMRYTRLFHNHPKIKFSGQIHEQIDDSLFENGFEIINTEVEIIHTGYNLSGEELKNKAQRNLDILKKEYEENASAYNSFQLANTYSLLKEYDSAFKYYSIAVNNEDLNKEYKAHAYLNLTDYEFKRHNIQDALKFLTEGLLCDSENPSLNLLACDIYFRINEEKEAVNHCKIACEVNKKILSGEHKSIFAIGLNQEMIISKGIYYSFLSSNITGLKYFFKEIENVNKDLCRIISKLINNDSITSEEKDELIKLISDNNIDLMLLIIEKYNDKKSGLDILNSIRNTFNSNSRYLKTLGQLYYENNFFDEAINEYENSLHLEDKDPAAVFYLVSVYIERNVINKIPDLLLFAEKEFGNIPEFNAAFEVLKQKLQKILNFQSQEVQTRL